MEKKGQVTLFIIIAILVVGIGVSFFIFKDSIFKDNEVSSEISPIKNFVDSCIEKSIEESVYLIGEGGGYYFPPILSNSDGYTYYFYEGEDYFPSLKTIENQFSSAISTNLILCVRGFEEFKEYEIEQKNPNVDVEILKDRILFDVEFPLKIEKGGETYLLKDFGEYKFYVNLGKIHESIYYLIKDNYFSEEGICLDCFSEMIVKNNFRIDIIEGGVGNSVFIIGDYNKDYNRTFNYIFAA